MKTRGVSSGFSVQRQDAHAERSTHDLLYSDVIMGAMPPQIIGLSIVY